MPGVSACRNKGFVMTDQVVDSDGKEFSLTFTKGLPAAYGEVHLFLLDDGSIHQGVINYRSETFPQGAVSTTNPIGCFHEVFEISLRRVAGYASSAPQYDARERASWFAADFVGKPR